MCVCVCVCVCVCGRQRLWMSCVRACECVLDGGRLRLVQRRWAQQCRESRPVTWSTQIQVQKKRLGNSRRSVTWSQARTHTHTHTHTHTQTPAQDHRKQKSAGGKCQSDWATTRVWACAECVLMALIYHYKKFWIFQILLSTTLSRDCFKAYTWHYTPFSLFECKTSYGFTRLTELTVCIRW